MINTCSNGLWVTSKNIKVPYKKGSYNIYLL